MTGALRQFTARQQADGFVPSDIAGLELWLDADDPATITANASDEVSQWDDKSGNLRHASRTPDSGVQTGVATLNSRNVITHSGAQLSQLSALMPQRNLSATWFVVWDTAVQTNYMFIATNLDSSVYLGAASSGSTSTTLMAGFGTPSLFVDGAPFSGTRGDLHTLTADAAAIFAAVDTNTGAANYETSWGGGGDFYMQGGLAEVLCYAGALSTADRETVESYLASKWGITL